MNSEQSNKAVVLRMMEVFNRGDIEGYAQFFAERVINHGFPVSRQDIQRVIQDIKTTFPDAHFGALHVLAEGEWVMFRARLSGTHLGMGQLPVNGGMLVGVAPTRNWFSADHIHVMRLQDGLVHEHYACRDDIGMMCQLGLLANSEDAQTYAAVRDNSIAA